MKTTKALNRVYTKAIAMQADNTRLQESGQIDRETMRAANDGIYMAMIAHIYSGEDTHHSREYFNRVIKQRCKTSSVYATSYGQAFADATFDFFALSKTI